MASIPRATLSEREYQCAQAREGRTLMGLFADLWRETHTLVRDEAQLAKAELSEKVSRLPPGRAR